MKDAYKKQVQHNVHYRGNYQVDQRMTAVSYRLEDSHHKVIHDESQGTAEVDPEVGNRIGEDF